MDQDNINNANDIINRLLTNQTNTLHFNTNINIFKERYKVNIIRQNIDFYYPDVFNLGSLTKETAIFVLKQIPINRTMILSEGVDSSVLIIPTPAHMRVMRGKNTYDTAEIRRLQTEASESLQYQDHAYYSEGFLARTQTNLMSQDQIDLINNPWAYQNNPRVRLPTTEQDFYEMVKEICAQIIE